GAVGEQVVAGSIRRIKHRHRVPGPPDGLVGFGIVGAGHPDGAAAGLPGVGVALPRLATGLARRRDRIFLPQPLAGGSVKPGHPVAYALIAVRRTDNDLVLDRERRRGEHDLGRVREGGFPHDFSGLLVGRDDPRWAARGSHEEITPHRRTAVAVLLLLFRV